MDFRRCLSPRNTKFFTANQFECRLTQAKDEVDALPTETKAKQTTLSEFLWNRSIDLAKQALETKFIQGVRLGSLKPEQYGVYTIQDVAYCQDVVGDYSTLIKRTENEDIRRFLKQRQEDFIKYAQELMKQWHIKKADAIELGQAAKEYSDLEKEVASEYQPLYFVVVSIPCSRLWFWLANAIKLPQVPGNLYQFWIDENSKGDGGAGLQDFIDGHASSLDQEKALSVYRKAMVGEVNFFRSACGEELIPTEPLKCSKIQ